MDDRFINRELSWLAFDDRVLQLASEPGIPLLERAKFCAITTTNLDEFFQVRVAALKDQVAAGIEEPTADGRTASPAAGRDHACAPASSWRCQEAVFLDGLVPALAAEGIAIVGWADLDETDRKRMAEIYEQRIFPVLTPLAVDPSHPFPYISEPRPEHRGDGVGPRPRQRRPPLRPGQGADRVPPPGRGRRVPLPPGRGADHRPAPHAVLGDGHRGGGVVPGHPQRRPDAGGRGGRGPARGAGDGAAAAALQQGRAPGDLREHERRDARAADARARGRRRRRLPAAAARSTSGSSGSSTGSTAPTSRTGRGRRSRPGASPSPRRPTARSCR